MRFKRRSCNHNTTRNSPRTRAEKLRGVFSPIPEFRSTPREDIGKLVRGSLADWDSQLGREHPANYNQVSYIPHENQIAPLNVSGFSPGLNSFSSVCCTVA